jgi:hypothetical protein
MLSKMIRSVERRKYRPNAAKPIVAGMKIRLLAPIFLLMKAWAHI